MGVTLKLGIMKQIYLLFALLTMVVFSSCEGPIGPAGRDGFDGFDGRDGSDGVNTLSQVIEIQTSFDAINGYEQLYTFPQSVQVFESDLILVYLLFEQTTDNQGNAIDVWRLMPQTRILDQGLLQYNYDHTFVDVRLFLESDFDLSLLSAGDLENQIFRIAVVPGEYANAGKMNLASLQEVMHILNVEEKDISRVILN